MAEWSFRTMSRSELSIDPIQSEFFSTEAIDGHTDALVREAIQNTLDAVEPGQVASVRFWFSGAENALPAQNGYLTGLEKHLNAPGSGLRSVPNLDAGVPFLLIEDFGTHGLCGDIEQASDKPGKNHFYYFWRNVGRSGKQGSERGRWGLGKNVFPASSQINTFLGLTIRGEDPTTLLLGQSVLKVHEIDDVRMCPYGYFANVDENDQFAMPVVDEEELIKFRTDFHLSRTNEHGLSIAVLYPLPEINETGILKAVLRQYFYPIMTGLLSIRLPRNGAELTLDKQSLSQTISEMDNDFKAELEPLLQIAKWAVTVESPVVVNAPPQGMAPKWNTDAIHDEILSQLRPQFEQGNRLAFEVPVSIKRNSEPEQSSKFRVFLERDLSMQAHRPMFVREGLIITDAVRSKQPGVRALVVADDKPLAALLGDAENPAHTEWQSRSAHFKDRYRHGTSTLTYVKNSVSAIVQMLTQSKDEQDLTALADVFFLVQPPTPEEKKQVKEKKPKPGPEPPFVEPPEPPEPRPLKLSKVEGGFIIAASKPVAAAHIKAAYEVRRGDAFNRYHPADFEFGKEPIQIVPEQTSVIDQALNQLSVGPFEAGSKVTVTGFDPSRDLAVRVSVEEQ